MTKVCLNILIAAMAFIFSTASAEVITLELYINTNQCVNCNLALNAITELSNKVVKKIYFPQSNKAASEEIMESYADVKNVTLQYFDKKSGPFKSAEVRSYCLLFKGASKIDSFELGNLFSNLARINKLAVVSYTGFKLHKKIAIPDSVRFSDRVSVFCNGQRYNICDYILNKSVLLTFDPGFSKLSGSMQIKGSAFNSRPFLSSGIVDTTAYKLFYVYLKRLGKTKPHLDVSYLSDSCLYLLLSFPCAIVRPVERDTGIGGTLFLYKKNIFTLKSELFAIPEDQLPPFLSEEYFIANICAFYVKHNKAYFTLYQENPKRQNYFLAEYSQSKKRMLYKSLLPYKVSDSTYLNSNFGNVNLFHTTNNNNFFFATHQPYIIDTKSNIVYDLYNFPGLKSKHELQIRDVCQQGDLLKIMANVKNIEKCVVYNTRKKTFISETTLKPSQSLDIESLKFINFKTLVALDENHRNLLIYELE